jgi:hypothetical protein
MHSLRCIQKQSDFWLNHGNTCGVQNERLFYYREAALCSVSVQS